MDIQTFKLSKTGKTIIIIIIVVVFLCGLLVYIAAKKQKEISKQDDFEPETEPEIVNAIGEVKVIDETHLNKVFDDYRANKYASYKEAVKASGLSQSTFFRKLRKHEKG